jgi:hypothetical protein
MIDSGKYNKNQEHPAIANNTDVIRFRRYRSL